MYPKDFLAKYPQGGRGVPEPGPLKRFSGSQLGFEGGQGELLR